MVPRPGWTPSAVSAATRSVTSALKRAARAAPSRIRAVIGPASVSEVALAGEHHGDPVLVGGGHHLAVFDRSARLDHCRHPGRGEDVEPIAEREEGVAGRGATPGPVARLAHGDLGRLDPALLTGTDAEGLATARHDDGVGR